MDRARQSRRGAAAVRSAHSKEADAFDGESGLCGVRRARLPAGYFAPVAAAYFLRNLSTRPAVSTIFCLPV
jgi:hypothetical protein